jgi:hypothetical protein
MMGLKGRIGTGAVFNSLQIRVTSCNARDVYGHAAVLVQA